MNSAALANTRLHDDLAALDRFGRGEDGGFTRLAWSPELRAAIEWAGERMREAGLTTEIDPAGNLLGRWEVGEGKAVVLGSHLDTVTSGGRFDGALGVLTGLEAVLRLRDEGFQPAHPVWLVAFMDEEGERFSSAMLGSRAFVGDPIADEEAERMDVDGLSLGEAMRAWKRDFRRLGEARCIDDVHCYLELHCELGPVLEAHGIEIGVVTEIVGLVGLSVALEGTANHAGTTPMRGRRDALVGAASAITALRDRALESGRYMATVGTISTTPGGANAIPGSCTFSVDLRAGDEHGLAAAKASVNAVLAEVCEDENLTFTLTETYSLAPVPLDREMRALLSEAAEQAGVSHLPISSGAGHDAMLLAPHVPAGMVFVPSVGGVGHAPAELTLDADVENGAVVLTRALRRLAG